MESSSAESSDYSVSYSLSMTSPTLGSGSSQGQSSEVIRSEDGTHRPSKLLSWKEMLQLESATGKPL